MGRSNARAGPSQKPSQTQRTHSGRARVEEVPEEEEENNDDDDDDDDDDDKEEDEGAGGTMDVDDADSVRTK